MLPDRMMLKTINIREGTGMQEMILRVTRYMLSLAGQESINYPSSRGYYDGNRHNFTEKARPMPLLLLKLPYWPFRAATVKLS